MQTKVDVYDGYTGAFKVSLPVTDAQRSSAYFIKSIDGLGPLKANIRTVRYANRDGGIFRSSNKEERTLILNVGMNPSTTNSLEARRKQFYKYFPTEGAVRLQFFNDVASTVEIVGWVESVIPKMFDKIPGAVVTVRCPESYFQALNPVIVNGFNNQEIPLSAVGTGDSGFQAEISVTRSISSFTITNAFVDPTIWYSGSLLSGDLVKVSTIPNNKYLQRVRSGVTTNILEGLVNGGMGMALSSITPYLKVSISGANDIPVKITYTPAENGI